jgi:hypothetical protein
MWLNLSIVTNDTELKAYREIFSKAKTDLFATQEALGQCIYSQQILEKKIADLRQAIFGLANLVGEEFIEEDELGLTDRVRLAFKSAAGTPMGAIEVKRRLEQMGYDLSRYGNVLASIHTVINRLVQQREIKQTALMSNGKPAYIRDIMRDVAEKFLVPDHLPYVELEAGPSDKK